MKSNEEIKKALQCRSNLWYCTLHDCAYYHDKTPMCSQNIARDALDYIQQLETREWELFDLMSSAWYGKGCYFKQDDGTVYSRVSYQYLSFNQAIDEFASALANTYVEPVRHGYWIEPDDEDVLTACICSTCDWHGNIMEDDVMGMNYCPNCGARMDAHVNT